MEDLIAWDGYVRVDYVPTPTARGGSGQLQVTVLTVEPTAEADLRPGLRAGFVADDPNGPPAFIGARLARGRLPGDLRDLLGASLIPVAEQVIEGPPRSRWTRLNLRALAALAAAWAPYRDRVLVGAHPPDGEPPSDEDLPPPPGGRAPWPRVGTWEHGLWALLAEDELRRGMSDLVGAGQLEWLGPGGGDEDGADDEDDDLAPSEAPVQASGRWLLPGELAERAGIAADLDWEIRGGLVYVVASRSSGRAPQDRPIVEISFDDGAGRWEPLVADPDGRMRAVIASAADPGRLPAVRIRVTTTDADAS